jgi:hypothetical protein
MAVTYTATTVASPTGAQGSYPQTLTKGHEGLVGDAQAYVARSYSNETAAVVPFGHLVIRDGSAADDGVKLPAGASATDVLGIAVSTVAYEKGTDTVTAYSAEGYPAKERVNVLSKGVVYVYSAHAIALGDAVRVFHTDSASASSNGGYKGRFGKTAEAGKSFEVTAGARWLSACAAGGIALLEIDIPGLTVSADT